MIDRILSAIPSIIIVFGIDFRVITWNPAAERHLGVSSEDAVGCRLADLPVSWDGNGVGELLLACLESKAEARNDALAFIRSDRSPGVLGVTTLPLLDELGAPDILLFLAADRTERLAEEQQLIQAQKLESIGQLAAGVAHEINTPTQYVADNARYLQRAVQKFESALSAYKALLDDPSQFDARVAQARAQWAELKLESHLQNAPAAIAESLDGLDRISTIVRAMKEFSHPGSQVKNPTDLNRCIESTVTVARNEWKYVATVELDLDPNLQAVPCLAGEFNQVILNMLVNASHAIGDVVGDSGDLGQIALTTKQRSDVAVITIHDTGAGIPDHIRARIFDPFFTTKEVGKGTGQGLALAYDVIVRRHGGQIDVGSEVGVGTTFTITMPIKVKEASAAA